MDENDDKLLAAYDLTAWEAPPAPEGMVGRIISRARVPEAAAMKRSWTWKRTALIAGTAAAALAAVLAFVVFGTERAPKNGGGLVRATNAQRLELGASFATLDAGTELHWQRRGTYVDVVQLKGGAVWNVSPHDTFVIETEDAGTTVASVEATGASLRTEVQMLNRTDARVIGIGSAVAALVSVTTVVVYEGHVRATSNGQVVNIQSGSTAQFPPSAPSNQQPDPQLNVGAGPVTPPACNDVAKIESAQRLHSAGAHVDALVDLIQAYQCKADPDTARRAAIEACHARDSSHAVYYRDLSTKSARGEIADQCQKFDIDFPDELDAADPSPCDANTARTKGEDFLNNGMDTAALSQFEVSLKCKDDTQTKKMAYIAACRLKNQAKAHEYFQALGAQQALTQVCMRFGIDPSAEPKKKTEKKDEPKKTVANSTCDAQVSLEKGEDFMNNGMDTAALSQFETSLRCKSDAKTMRYAYVVSCRLKNAAKAKYYFGKLGSQGSLVQVCMRFGIDPSQ